MITVTPEVTADADKRAAAAVAEAERRARENGSTLDPLTAFYLHKATWAGVTGAEVVRVER